MTRVQKDVLATLLTALVVLAFAATHEAWNVALIGDGHRWTAGAVLVLGVLTCALGSQTAGWRTGALATLGAAALGLGIAALVTGSLSVLSFLVLDIVVLWAVSTLSHEWVATGHGHRPAAT
jgi:hypothetical protein